MPHDRSRGGRFGPMRPKAAAAAAVVALVFAGCGEGGPAGETLETSRSTFDGEWPFTVESGVLACDGTRDLASITFTANGTTYGINGTALTRGKPRPDAIAKENPEAKTDPLVSPQVPLGDVLDRGRELCK